MLTALHFLLVFLIIKLQLTFYDRYVTMKLQLHKTSRYLPAKSGKTRPTWQDMM